MIKRESNGTRAAGYCRTSGEGQRDNTSIPSQKAAIEAYCKREGWAFKCHYVDECRSGAKIAGRDEFQKLMRDAAAGEFDVVVVYQLSRFGRDGTDIMESARTLKREFSVNVIDTAGQFDTRDPNRVLGNFVLAGVTEHERITILQRMTSGRIARAREGKPWAPGPIGRAYDKQKGNWYVTDLGKTIATALQRYADGESLTALGREYGILKHQFSRWVSQGQLAGTYHVRFRASDINVDETVSVPAIPEVVPPALLSKVKARMAHNRQWNRTDAKQYPLSGFVFCERCGKALTGGMVNAVYYRHNKPFNGDCGFLGVRGKSLEESVLDALYTFFLDEPRFNEAIQATAPTVEHRIDLVSQRQAAARRLAKVDAGINRLVEAIINGADAGLLVDRQDELKAERAKAQQQIEEFDRRLAELPAAEDLKRSAELVRLDLEEKFRAADWRVLDPADVKRFLHHLFGPNPRKAGTGIFIGKTDAGLRVTLRGAVDLGFLSDRFTVEALQSAQFAKVKTAYRKWQRAEGQTKKLAHLIDTVERAEVQACRKTKELAHLIDTVERAEVQAGRKVSVRRGTLRPVAAN